MFLNDQNLRIFMTPPKCLTRSSGYPQDTADHELDLKRLHEIDPLDEVMGLKKKFKDFESRLARFDDRRIAHEQRLHELAETSSADLEHLSSQLKLVKAEHERFQNCRKEAMVGLLTAFHESA